jgi:TorA maturation chaperone TorD
MYKFLAATFLEPPGPRLFAPLFAEGFLAELEELFGAAALADLHEFVRTFQGDYGALDQEFQSLFTVPLGRYVTPYESVYRDEREIGDTRVRGLLMGPSTLAVKHLYREAGLLISEDFKDLPDHIGLELACMEFLCRAEARAWSQEDLREIRRARDLQRRLLCDHLLQWAPALCARIQERAPGPLYRGIARLTEAYLAQEAEVSAIPTLAG